MFFLLIACGAPAPLVQPNPPPVWPMENLRAKRTPKALPPTPKPPLPSPFTDDTPPTTPPSEPVESTQ